MSRTVPVLRRPRSARVPAPHRIPPATLALFVASRVHGAASPLRQWLSLPSQQYLWRRDLPSAHVAERGDRTDTIFPGRHLAVRCKPHPVGRLGMEVGHDTVHGLVCAPLSSCVTPRHRKPYTQARRGERPSWKKLAVVLADVNWIGDEKNLCVKIE